MKLRNGMKLAKIKQMFIFDSNKPDTKLTKKETKEINDMYDDLSIKEVNEMYREFKNPNKDGD